MYIVATTITLVYVTIPITRVLILLFHYNGGQRYLNDYSIVII